MSGSETVKKPPKTGKVEIKAEKRPSGKLIENSISLKFQSKATNYSGFSTECLIS
jgi:hypothetical protein